MSHKLLEGKTVLVTGVLNTSSLAFSIAENIVAEDGSVVLTSFDRVTRITRKVASKLGDAIEVVEFDALKNNNYLAAQLEGKVDSLDGIVHAIAKSPIEAVGGGFVTASSASALECLEISAVSLQKLAVELEHLLNKDSSIVALGFDASRIYPGYDWLGVSKAALESIVRYLALYLGKNGIRVNILSAGPVDTFSTQNLPGFAEFKANWEAKAPLGWSAEDRVSIATTCVALLSDLTKKITGDIIHVDGGYHTVGY